MPGIRLSVQILTTTPLAPIITIDIDAISTEIVGHGRSCYAHAFIRSGRLNNPNRRQGFLRLLADESRQAIVRLLALSDRRAGEIGALIRLPPNAVSYHLKQLRAIGLLRDRRSSADARDMYYQLDIGRLHALYAAAGDALYPGIAASTQLAQPTSNQTRHPGFRNPCVSSFSAPITARARKWRRQFCARWAATRWRRSALGAYPPRCIPRRLRRCGRSGLTRQGSTAKSMEQFIGEPLDYIITVCDRVRDICPSFPGDPAQAHWSIADPAVVEDPERRAKAFREVLSELRVRIRYLLLLPHPGTGERFHSVH